MTAMIIALVLAVSCVLAYRGLIWLSCNGDEEDE